MTENIDILTRLRGARQVQADAHRAGAAIGGIDNQARRASAGLQALKYGAGLAAVAMGGLAVKVGIDSFKAFRDQARINRQTAAVIKSTGAVANVTTDDIARLSGALAVKTGVDDDVIQGGQNLLLTFKQIRNEAGKGNKVFDQATAATLDMSVALGKDMRGSSILVGKALNDPVKGLTRLERVGVSFTAGQKDQIKAMVEAGDVMGAQKIILRELNSEFGGSAAAQADPLKKLNQSWGELKETIGKALAPAIMSAAKWMTKFIDGMRTGTGDGGKFVQTLKGIVVPLGKAASDVWKFARAHPGLVKLLGVLVAAGVAIKAITFASQITGITRLLSLTGKLGAYGVRGGLALADGIAASFFPRWSAKSGGIRATIKRTIGSAGTAGGQAAAGNAASSVASNLPGRLSARMPTLKAAFVTAGKALGLALGVAAAAEIEKAIGDAIINAIGGDTGERREENNNNSNGDPLDWRNNLPDLGPFNFLKGHRAAASRFAPVAATPPVDWTGSGLGGDVSVTTPVYLDGRLVGHGIARASLNAAARA